MAKNYVNEYDIIAVLKNKYVNEDKKITKTAMVEVYKDFMAVLQEFLAKDQDVVLNGYMKFEHVQRKPGVRRNIYTGEPVNVPAKTVVKIRPRKKIYSLTKIHE